MATQAETAAAMEHLKSHLPPINPSDVVQRIKGLLVLYAARKSAALLEAEEEAVTKETGNDEEDSPMASEAAAHPEADASSLSSASSVPVTTSATANGTVSQSSAPSLHADENDQLQQKAELNSPKQPRTGAADDEAPVEDEDKLEDEEGDDVEGDDGIAEANPLPVASRGPSHFVRDADAELVDSAYWEARNFLQLVDQQPRIRFSSRGDRAAILRDFVQRLNQDVLPLCKNLPKLQLFEQRVREAVVDFV